MHKKIDKFRGKLNKKNYFEGYYYKINDKDNVFSVIVGVSYSNDSHSFIQVLFNNESYYFKYDINDFSYNKKDNEIKILDNVFKKNHFVLNINKDEKTINGEFFFSEIKSFPKKLFRPSIMGFFEYFPFMECKHHILFTKAKVNGNVEINNKDINFSFASGYLEKDYGISFPKTYTWIQSYSKESDTFLFLSVANIPYLKKEFLGIISHIEFKNKNYNISTYNFAKIIKQTNNEIIIRNRKYKLEIKILRNEGQKLIAPIKGEMVKEILEDNNGSIIAKLSNKKEIIFNEEFNNCGIEIVK